MVLVEREDVEGVGVVGKVGWRARWLEGKVIKGERGRKERGKREERKGKKGGKKGERGRKERGNSIRYLDCLPDVTMGSMGISVGILGAQADGRRKARGVNRP